MPDKYELRDTNVNYETQNSVTNVSAAGKGGMYISTAKAFILAFLAIAIAVGVGIVVHFAGKGQTLECNCHFPEPETGNGNQAALEQCKTWAGEGNQQICSECPGGSTGTTCAPPTPSGATIPGTTATTTVKPQIDVRLPTDIEPLLYTVELQPHMYDGDPADFTFNGSVRILVRCRVATDRITLHMKKLNITGAITLTEENGVALLYKEVTYDTERQFMIVHATQTLFPGRNYTLDIASFVGPLVPDLAGLYLSSYRRGNETIYITTSQMQATDARKTFPCMDEPAVKAEFEATLVRKSHMKTLSNMPIYQQEARYLATSLLAPIDARKVFPCMDEPALKAYFDVTLVRKKAHIAISNMPILSTDRRGDGWIADKFQRTPKMSTYLLAFIVCDFDYLENTTENGVLYRAWARPEAAATQAPYSLQVGVDILTFYEDYFNVTYPLAKQDMIAIPDFAAGAMENWGLITYRETAMLYEPGVSSEGNKQRVAVVVSHELAHQWFGNLVTPSWWDDLWLNEGFASYVEYLGVDHVHPEWKMFEQFVVEDLQDVFNFDGLVSSHPVYVPVSHPDEINEIFDRISYGKGASIIRMMKFFLGDNTFRKGLTNYLTNLAYGAAFHDDLWYALGNQSVTDGNQITDVKGVMDTWTLQMNFPTIMVDYTQAGRVRLSQSRYLRDPTAPDPGKYVSPFGYKWDVPFTYTTSSGPNFDVTKDDITMMSRDVAQVEIVNPNIPAPEGTNWVVGNVMQYGYYRVNYNKRNWEALIDQLKSDHEVIVPINRAQIINDAWNLARSGDLEMEIALRTTEYLSRELEFVPRIAATRELGNLDTLLAIHPLYGSFSRFMRNITEDVFVATGMDNSGASHLESFLRSGVVNTACSYGIEACIVEAGRLFAEWMANPDHNPIDPGIKSTVYCTAVAAGGIKEWEFVLGRYGVENLAAEKSRLLSALSCTKEIWILSKYLEMSIDSSQIRRQDTVSVIVGISHNPIGRALAWDFFRANWDFFLNDFGAGTFGFPRLVSGVTSSFYTKFRLDQLNEFIQSKDDLGSGARAFDQALEKTRSNIQWMDKNVPIIEKWLTDQGF